MPARAKSEPNSAIPRFRWLRRSLLGLLLLALGLVALRLAWGAYAERKLAEKIAQYRAAGEPVYPEDLPRTTLRPEDNAAEFLRKAATKFVDGTFPNGLTLLDADDDPYLLIDYPDESARMIAANTGALQALAGARLAGGCDVGVDEWFPISLGSMSSSEPRKLGAVAAISAMHAHLQRNDADAVELLRDAVSVADRTNALGGVISRLMSAAVDAKIADVLQFVLPALLDDSGVRYVNPQYAQRDQIIALQRELWNEDRDLRNWRECIQRERLFFMGHLGPQVAGKPILLPGTSPDWRSSVIAALFAPVWQLNTVGFMNTADKLALDCTVPQWREFPTENKSDSIALRPYWLSQSLLNYRDDSITKMLPLHLNGLLRRRFAATAIAIRLYQLDHGRRPATLNELVPKYLAKVPRDLLAHGDVPIGYVPYGKQPRLYSVGRDGIDQGGIEPRRGDGYRGKVAADMLFQLDRRNIEMPNWSPQRARVSRKTIDDNRDIERNNPADRESQPAAEQPD